MRRVVLTAIAVLVTGWGFSLVAAEKLEAQIIIAPCMYYCRPAEEWESGHHKCDNTDITEAPCEGTFFSQWCFTGCVESPELADATGVPALDLAPFGGIREDRDYQQVLAQRPQWGEAVPSTPGMVVARSSCGIQAIVARAVDEVAATGIRERSRVLQL